MMDELLAQFLIEGRDLVAQASDDFARLQHQPDDAGTVDSAFRAVHTLKGSVGIFPMGPAERVLHAAEEVLERARKGTILSREAVGALVACLDAVDRWIDQIEQTGALAPGAERVADDALARLPGSAEQAPKGSQDAPEWLAPLVAREAAVLDAAPGTLVAFRHTPDPECFFRGDDPLAMAAAVPDLVALSILPAEGAWPVLDAIEPFTCFSILEGLSAAPLSAVQAAFRLVPDQVSLHPITRASEIRPVAGDAQGGTATLRVEAARVDALGDRLSELIVAVNGFAPLAAQADPIDEGLAARIRAVQADMERVSSDLHRSVSAVRLVSLAPTLRRLPRMVREIAAGLGKQVTFTMSGEALEVDKAIADGLFEPLLHLVRNALDHGIEAPEARQAAGKPAEGQLRLIAARDGDAVRITLSDDGAGIDPARIRDVAIARDLLPAEDAARLSDEAALRLIFAPGFSTARQVTEVSGRGVGMDAVQTAVERMRGTIDIDSRPGQGTGFRLRLPANALTTRLLVVEVGDDRYGVALDQIVETVRIGNDKLVPVGQGVACVLRGRAVPVLSLAALLGGAEPPASNAKLLVTRSGGERVALKVRNFAERIDAIVRPPSGLLASVPGVIGSTLLGDGGVLLVLDLPELAA